MTINNFATVRKVNISSYDIIFILYKLFYIIFIRPVKTKECLDNAIIPWYVLTNFSRWNSMSVATLEVDNKTGIRSNIGWLAPVPSPQFVRSSAPSVESSEGLAHLLDVSRRPTLQDIRSCKKLRIFHSSSHFIWKYLICFVAILMSFDVSNYETESVS